MQYNAYDLNLPPVRPFIKSEGWPVVGFCPHVDSTGVFGINLNTLYSIFWSQHLGSEHPVRFSDQLKQLVELHRLAELAMKDLIVRLWPADPVPSSYFGLVNRLVSACPRLEAVKQSVCIEGARMAFARVKTHWAKLDAKKLMTEGPPKGKEHRRPKHYFDGVLEGSPLWQSNVRRMLYSNENMYITWPCSMEQRCYVV